MSLDSNIKNSLRVVDKAIELNSADITQKDLHVIGLAAKDEIRNNIQSEGHVITGSILASVDIYEETPDYVTVGSDEEGAVPLEYGRGPVEAVNKKALAFKNKQGDQVIVKRVGPAEPTGVFERGVLTAVPKALEDIAAEKKRQLEASK